MTNKTYQTTLLIRGDSKNAVRSVKLTRDELDKLTKSQSKSTSVSGQLSAAFTKVNKSVGNATRSLGGLGTVIGVLGIGKLVSETIQAADTYASLQGQLKLVTGSQEELNQVYGRSLALANKTGQSTEATVKLYARLARSTEELSLTQENLFTITEAINQSFVVSGATSTEAASATLQLSQGLAAGALRGEELNSVMENSPRLARALADGLGVGIGRLREMGAAGELTAESVTSALLRTASTIEGEFNAMPMTVGRVMQTLANDINDALGQVDTGELIGGVEELREVLADPATKEAITSIAGSLISLVSNGVGALSTITNLTKFIAEEFSAAINGVAIGDLPRLEGALYKAKTQLKLMEEQGSSASIPFANLKDEIAELEKKIEITNSLTKDYAVSTEDLSQNLKDEAKKAEELAIQYDSLTEIKVTATRITQDQFSNGEKLIGSMREQLRIMGLTSREQAIATSLSRANWATTVLQREEIELLAGALYDESEALKVVTKETKEAQKAVDPFASAVVHAAERIDEAFADAWKGAFDSFNDFADGLKDAFKQLLAEMAHAAITKPILLSLGASVGIGGSAGAAAGTGGASSLLSGASSIGGLLSGGVSGALGSLGGAASGLYNTIGTGASALADITGSSAIGGFATDSFGAGFTTTGLGALGNIGGGLVGGLAGSAVFGETSGIGSTIGGALGSVYGPIGAAIGSFIGAGLESAIPGGGKHNNAGKSEFNLGTGAVNTFGVGSNFDQGNVDAAGGITDALSQFSAAIGGSSFSGTVKVGNASGFKLNSEKFATANGLLLSAFDDIVDSSANLTPALKELLKAFDGTAEETLLFSKSIISMSEAVKFNAVDEAVRQFTAAQEAASTTLFSAYNSNISVFKGMVDNFDGSAISASNLNTALSMNQDAAFQLALGIQSLTESISVTFGETAKYFRDSLLTEGELQQARLDERRAIVETIDTLTDPAEIEAAAARYEELQRSIFAGFDPETQVARANTIAANTEFAGEKFNEQLALSLESTRQSQEDTNAMVSDLLKDAAVSLQKPVDDFGGWVQYLVNNGITINVNQGSEVNV
ncbi:MAG: tape measure domain-containing protein [Halioglobus sp.]|jgi:tape measure domain-containing protein